MSNDEPKKLFEDIAPDTSTYELESLCMNCHEMGLTRMMLTRIPFFKDVILMAFYCPHCYFRNSEVQPAGTCARTLASITHHACRAALLLKAFI